jgi:type IV pilus assembly protein PilN
MIRINLLSVPKNKGKRAQVSLPGEGVSLAIKALAVFAIAGMLNYGYWYRLDHEKTRLQTQTAQAERRNRELAEVKARYLERQKQMENYKHRVDVIDQLRSNQSGEPVKLLATLGNTVNNTEAVWLSNMKDEGASIHIEGMALSQKAVANLITNLEKTGYFRNVEIKETYQDDTVKDMQAFQFTLTCEKLKS